MRKDWNGEKTKKIVEIDPFFAGLIQNSNMIGNCKLLQSINPTMNSQPKRTRFLWIRQSG